MNSSEHRSQRQLEPGLSPNQVPRRHSESNTSSFHPSSQLLVL